MDLDTFLTTLYVLVDDWYKGRIAPTMQRHAGRPAVMSDSEVLTVALAGRWQVGVPWRSERGLVRYMQKHGRGWFPTMLERSAFNTRTRHLWGAFLQLQQLAADWLSQADDVYLCVDAKPLPTCTLAQASSRRSHWLGLSQLGHGGNQRWFYGDKLLAVVTPRGVITGWLVSSGAVNDRWLMEVLLCCRAGQTEAPGPQPDPHAAKRDRSTAPTGTLRHVNAAGQATPCPYIADRNFKSPRWQSHWRDAYGGTVLTKPRRNEAHDWSPQLLHWFGGLRQIVDTTFARLDTVFGFQHLNAHSYWGQLTQIAAGCAAYNLGLLFNQWLGRPLGALATLIC